MNKKEQGKKNRASGQRFELKVRKDLESKGWIVDKWTNNIKDNKLVPAMSNRFNMRSMGFPDFVAFKNLHLGYKVIAVECKTGKYLDKEEKAKVKWYLDNNIFSKIFVAYEDKKEIKFREKCDILLCPTTLICP